MDPLVLIALGGLALLSLAWMARFRSRLLPALLLAGTLALGAWLLVAHDGIDLGDGRDGTLLEMPAF
jgi:uncharacterized membrane protein (GlpM family)